MVPARARWFCIASERHELGVSNADTWYAARTAAQLRPCGALPRLVAKCHVADTNALCNGRRRDRVLLNAYVPIRRQVAGRFRKSNVRDVLTLVDTRILCILQS